MTNNLVINTGSKRLTINDGPDYLEFNPSDVVFVEKFYNMVTEFKTKSKEFETQAAEIDGQVEVDENGIPLNMVERMAFVRQLCEFSYSQIDEVFGEGTSLKLFGGAKSLDLIEQFFSGLMPFVQAERDKKLEKYRADQSKVMQ